jgi:hypothetical protein
MQSVQPQFLERTSTLEQQYFLQIQLAEEQRGVMTLFKDFLDLPTTSAIKGVQLQYLSPLQELVQSMQPTDSVYLLLWDLLGHTKKHISGERVELLLTIRALLVNFANYLTENQETLFAHHQRYSPTLTQVEKFYLQLILTSEHNLQISIRTFAMFMLENRENFQLRYQENFTKILANTARFTKSAMCLSDYYSQMVKYMRSNGCYDADLQVFNGIILRYLNQTETK